MALETQMNVTGDEWWFYGKFRRVGGPGALLESLDGAMQLCVDEGGYVACRVAGELQVTSVPTSAMVDVWTIIVLRQTKGIAQLFLDHAVVMTWEVALDNVRGLRIMPDVDADVAEFGAVEAYLPDGDVPRIVNTLHAKQHRRVVSARRGFPPTVRDLEP